MMVGVGAGGPTLLVLCWLAAGAGGQHAEVRVERVRLGLEQDLTIAVSGSVEYIVDIITSTWESVWPVRVLSELVDMRQAVLLTARRAHVADTWQLGGDTNVTRTQRTLCAPGGGDAALCEGEEGAWSVHVSAACARVAGVRLRLSAATDWLLHEDAATAGAVSANAPLVLRYQWPAETQRGVRLLAESPDGACVVVAVCNYTCPVPQSVASLPGRCMRMTMLRSAAVYVKRSEYPAGLVVVAVSAGAAACGLLPHPPPHDEWLWDAAVGAPRHTVSAYRPPDVKQLTFTVQPPLEQWQYAVAGAVTLAVFLAFYATVGALLAAYRWAPCRRRLPCLRAGSGGGGVASTAPPRRHSVATYDGSDVSDSDEEAGSGASGTQRAAHMGASETDHSGPFGLPRSLRLQTTSRRRARTLRARARRYRDTVLVVAVFYTLPVLQLVAAFQLLLNVSGQLDLCYYNYQCSHPVGALSDFNHVFSNAGYVLLGALLVAQVHARRRARSGGNTGVPPRDGMMDALGAGLMVLGLLSAAYHVCPNRLNFQFDTAFMYVLSLVTVATVHAARHADVAWRAHGVFALLAVMMACVVGGVLGGGPVFWAVWTAAHLATATVLTLKVYYLGQFKLSAWHETVVVEGGRPRYVARLVVLLAVNAANWGLALYGVVMQPSDFAGHLLWVLLGNALLSLLGYLGNKVAHGERPRAGAWALLAGAGLTWPAALYLFLWGSSDWSAAPAASRHLNHPCLVLGFYDAHDLWHLLSAAALYFTFTAMLLWDDDLDNVPRDQIPVF